MYYNQTDVISVRQFDAMSSNILSGEGCYSFICVLEGAGCAMLNSERFTASKDELFILRPTDFLYVMADKPAEFRMVQVVFRLYIQKLVRDIEKCHPKQETIGKIIRPIVLKMLSDAIVKPLLYQNSINLSAASLLLEIIRNDNARTERRACIRWMTPLPAGFNHSLYSLIEYIDAYIDTTLTIIMLADYIHATTSTVRNLFRLGFNTTPLQYINTVRINNAKELMMCTNLNITEVAMHTGFNSIHYFSRYFKEKEKITPLEFKKQLAKNISIELHNKNTKLEGVLL